MKNTGSVTGWLGLLREGRSEAADALWERYFRRLQGLARAKLPAALRRSGGDEAVAADAFASLWRGVDAGRFPELAGRDQLWRLLIVITLRKASRLARTESRERAIHVAEGELERVLGRDPDPEFAAQAAEQCERLMAALADPTLEAVARLRLDGATVPDIAGRLGCSPRTIDRKIALIQTVWSREFGP
jgi:DNA-directed RNA polymerase specialized sigma24 family protein